MRLVDFPPITRVEILADRLYKYQGHYSDCWVWKGAKNDKGYGQCRVNNKTEYTHRMSYELHKGNIPEGKYILHTCDTPLCFNPRHLFVGTQQDNMDDMISKSRAVHARGEDHAQAKLNQKQVDIIRHLVRYKSSTYQQIGDTFSVSRSTISSIANGATWRDITMGGTCGS